MDAVKEEFCFLNELLYALYGFGGDTFQINRPFHTEAYQTRFQKSSYPPLIEELLNISSLYCKTKYFLTVYSTDPDEFYFSIYDMINGVVNQTYIEDLISLDFYGRLKNESMFKVNCLLKYKHFFSDILDIVTAINVDNKCLALLKLTNLFEMKYDLRFDYRNDPFFQGIWIWMTKGVLPIYHHSFISLDAGDNISLDFSKFPDSIEPTNVIQIHNIGNLLRMVHAQGIKTSFEHLSLYWEYFDRRFEICNSSVLFKEFLNDVKKFVFENILQITKLKESYFEIILHLKSFYLFGCESFWMNFTEICKSGDEDSDIKILFLNALHSTFDYTLANYYNSCISVKSDLRKRIHLKFNFKQAPLMSIMISENSLNKFQNIFSHLYKLHLARHDLASTLKDSSSNVRSNKEWYLRSCLFTIFTNFFMYCKFCIEDKFADHIRSIDNTIEIDEIQKLHQVFLLDIINQLFIRNIFIINLQKDLIKLSHKLKNPNRNIDKLFKEYERIVTILRDSFKLNRKHIKIFYEILEYI